MLKYVIFKHLVLSKNIPKFVKIDQTPKYMIFFIVHYFKKMKRVKIHNLVSKAS